ncbi:MAG: sugar kinase [Cyclobacteriaceae bacterium]|nr:sugar kinase [Cyclobacteriaceae bacterium]
MKTDVLAIGELLVDIISEAYVDNLSQAKMFSMHQGGSPANVCGNLQWLGAKAAIVSCIGNDGAGEFILEALRKTGLTDAYIIKSITHPTSLVLVGRSKGTPDFIAYRMADTQIPALSDQLIENSSIIHSCAFALSKNPSQQNILNAFARAKAKNKIISIDWNFAPSIWGTDNGRGVFEHVCALKPLLKFSLDDTERFIGHTLSVEDAKSFLTPIPAAVTCLTCGKDGVWYKTAETDWTFTPAVPVAVVKDTTGAGDAFWAGFLSGYIKMYNTADCVAEGLRIAGMKVQKIGPLYGA